MANEPNETSKNVTKNPSVKKRIIRKRPVVVKKSPESVLKNLFEGSFGSKSPIVQALSDNKTIDSLEEVSKTITQQQEDLKNFSETSKGLAKNIVNSTTKFETLSAFLKTVIKGSKTKAGSPSFNKEDRIFKQLKENNRNLSILTKNIVGIRSLLSKQDKHTKEGKIKSEVEEFGQLLKEKETTSRDRKFGTPTHQLNPVEKGATELFGKGFHYITGLISETIHKKILKNKNPKLQENLPEELQSPQHKSYLKTKSQINTVKDWMVKLDQPFNTFFKKSEEKNIPGKETKKPRTKKAPATKKSKNVDSVKKSPKKETDIKTQFSFLGKTIKTENRNIVSAVNKVKDVLQIIAQHFSDQTEIKKEETPKTTEAKNKKPINQPITENEPGADTTESPGLLSKSTSLIKGGIKKVSPIARTAISKIATFAKKPIGLGAGVATIGAAALTAGHYMDKTSRQMMDASYQETQSQAAVSHKMGELKRTNPKAYELTQLNEKIRKLQSLPRQTPEVQKNITNLKQQYNTILEKNAKEKKAPEKQTLEKESNKQPTIKENKTTETIAPIVKKETPLSSINEKPTPIQNNITKAPELPTPIQKTFHSTPTPSINPTITSLPAMDGVVAELKSGKIIDILTDIRDSINKLHFIANSPNKQGVFALPGESNTVMRSSISKQRDSLRVST